MFSSAFNSLGHHLLPQRLSASFGFTDKPLEGLHSFLPERTKFTVFGSSRSSWVLAPFTVTTEANYYESQKSETSEGQRNHVKSSDAAVLQSIPKTLSF